jgi:hypothetical protein
MITPIISFLEVEILLLTVSNVHNFFSIVNKQEDYFSIFHLQWTSLNINEIAAFQHETMYINNLFHMLLVLFEILKPHQGSINIKWIQ